VTNAQTIVIVDKNLQARGEEEILLLRIRSSGALLQVIVRYRLYAAFHRHLLHLTPVLDIEYFIRLCILYLHLLHGE
jgi:hypothetical protein